MIDLANYQLRSLCSKHTQTQLMATVNEGVRDR